MATPKKTDTTPSMSVPAMRAAAFTPVPARVAVGDTTHVETHNAVIDCVAELQQRLGAAEDAAAALEVRVKALEDAG